MTMVLPDALVPDGGDWFADMTDPEKAERAATLQASGMSPRQVARACGISLEEAQQWITAGRLAVVRTSPEDVRATHILLIRAIITRAAADAADPGPLLDRAGRPVTDEHGRAFPDTAARDRAHQTQLRAMEREARLTGADAPATTVHFDVARLRAHLEAQGVPQDVIDGQAPLAMRALPAPAPRRPRKGGGGA